VERVAPNALGIVGVRAGNAVGLSALGTTRSTIDTAGVGSVCSSAHLT